LWSDDLKSAGVFHAGWRGVAKGMPKAAVAALGVPAERLSAAAGPHIRSCCYKVGAELEKEFPASSLERRGDELHLDMAADVRRQLRDAGLADASISTEAPCTSCNPTLLYSYRREKQDARMLALLSLRRWDS
jgi:copper oxidase (laccase) domain-containing protein